MTRDSGRAPDRAPRIHGFEYVGPCRYAVTVCTHARRSTFINAQIVTNRHILYVLGNPMRAGLATLRLPFDVDGDRRAKSFQRAMQVVTKLQRQPVLAGGELHVDDVLAVPEMHPRRCTRDDGARRQAVGVDRHVMVPKVRSALGDRSCRDRGQLIVLDTKLEPDRALHGRAVLRLNKEHPWSCRF